MSHSTDKTENRLSKADYSIVFNKIPKWLICPVKGN